MKNFIGIKFPLERSVGNEGYFESTSLTMDAVKENFEIAKKINKGIPEMVDFFTENYIMGDLK